jgi:hypothetical protein
MLEPVTVWMVRQLRRGADLREVEGTLRLDDDAVVFTDRTADAETRLPFAATSKVKRIMGSPVLVLTWRDRDDEGTQTAFYFAKPPPMRSGPDRRDPQPPVSLTRQPSRRRQRREGIGYLTARSRTSKATIKAWAEEIRARARGAR